jgi:hypothetical protein
MLTLAFAVALAGLAIIFFCAYRLVASDGLTAQDHKILEQTMLNYLHSEARADLRRSMPKGKGSRKPVAL